MIRELIHDFPQLKFITMSGFTKSLGCTSLEFTKRLGAQWTLPKPFEIADMLEAVEKVLAQTDPVPVLCS